MADYAKPIPVPDEATEGFWQAAKEHRLAFQRCQHCGYYFHPPAIVCSNCRAYEPSFAWATVSGRGKVKSWVTYRDALVGGFEADIPWVNVLVELEEQPGLIFLATLADGAGAPLRHGAPVEVTFRDITPDVTLPMFKLR